RLTAAAALILFLLLGVWVFAYYRQDQQLARAQELRQQLTGEAGRKLTADQRRDLRKRYGEELKQLSPEQRRELAKNRREAMHDKLKKFFQLSKKDRTAAVDQDIDRMEKMRKQRAAAGSGSGAAGPKGPGARGGGPPPNSQDREHMRRQRLDE